MASSNESEKRTTKKPLLIDLTSTSEDIEKSFVSEKTTVIYNGILVRFIMWLFDNHKHHIKPSIMMILWIVMRKTNLKN